MQKIVEWKKEALNRAIQLFPQVSVQSLMR